MTVKRVGVFPFPRAFEFTCARIYLGLIPSLFFFSFNNTTHVHSLTMPLHATDVSVSLGLAPLPVSEHAYLGQPVRSHTCLEQTFVLAPESVLAQASFISQRLSVLPAV